MNNSENNTDVHTTLAATAYLLTRYALLRGTDELTCQTLTTAKSIHQHFSILLEQPEVQLSNAAHDSYSSLLQDWETIIVRHHQSAYCTCEERSSNRMDEMTWRTAPSQSLN